VRIVEPPRSITIELTEREATVLCALAGGIVWHFDTEAGNVLRDFHAALNKELPNREESFSDFFEGDVRVKT